MLSLKYVLSKENQKFRVKLIHQVGTNNNIKTSYSTQLKYVT